MATYRITYADKNKTAPLGSFEGQWRDDDANEVKRVVNNLAALVYPDDQQGGTPGSFGDMHVIANITDVDDVVIVHNLGKKPSVQVFDGTGAPVETWFKHVDNNSVRHMFNKPFTGIITYN